MAQDQARLGLVCSTPDCFPAAVRWQSDILNAAPCNAAGADETGLVVLFLRLPKVTKCGAVSRADVDLLDSSSAASCTLDVNLLSKIKTEYCFANLGIACTGNFRTLWYRTPGDVLYSLAS